MEKNGVMRHVFENTKARADRDERGGWGCYTKKLMLEFGFQREWDEGLSNSHTSAHDPKPPGSYGS